MMDSTKINTVTVCGPTASGKTSLGIEIAKQFNGEIISADSMQIYSGIPVATAQPTEAELSEVKHHFIGFLKVGVPYSVADYVEAAHTVISDVASRGKLPVIVGGTGLYIDSLINNIKFSDCGSTEVRTRLMREAELYGNTALYERLKAVDPSAAEKIEPNNVRRTVRALEVFEVTGVPYSEHNELSRREPSKYNNITFFINYKNRELLYERINRRVDIMLQNGIEDEARKFRPLCAENGAGQAIGHKELYPYLDGEISSDEAAENLKRATRRYAKRQISWFSRNENAVILYPDIEDITEKATKILKEEFAWQNAREEK